jgi:hypothetical protein
MNTLKQFFATLKTLVDDRLFIMLVPALCFLWSDLAVLYSLTYAVAIVVALVAVAHSLRLLILPYLSMRAIVAKATEAPMAAAVMFSSTLAFMGMLVYAMVAWIQAAAGHAA